MSTISAAEARVHPSDVLCQVRDHEIITVGHGSKPEVVNLFVEEDERLTQHAPRREQWREMLVETRNTFRNALGTSTNWSSQTMRDERDEDFLDCLR